MSPLLATILVGLATARVSELVVRDLVTEPVRERIRDRWPDTPGRAVVGWSRGALAYRASDVRRRVRLHGPGALVSCVYCVDVWASAAVVALAAGTVGCALPLLVWPASAAIASAWHRLRP